MQGCMRVGVSGDRCRGRVGVGKSVKLLLGEINILFIHVFFYSFLPLFSYTMSGYGYFILAYFWMGAIGGSVLSIYPFIFYTLLFFVSSFGDRVVYTFKSTP